ncbi:hypothetical protein J132_03146 [Termitomyces sp. J132]|nr:hypothetical protein J132_03146 [Termitomyces sp. J132]
MVRNARAFVEQQRELVRKGELMEVKPLSLKLPTSQEEVVIGGGGVARMKSREVVKSNKEEEGDDSCDNNGDDNVPLAQKCPSSPALVASEKGEEDVEMREMTSLATVGEVEQEASDMEVEGKEEFEAATVAIEEDKRQDEGAEKAKVQ